MTNTSLNISGKLDAPVVEVMEQLAFACSSLGADFLLVGAVARDIHFLSSTNFVNSLRRVYDLSVLATQLVKPLMRQKHRHSFWRSYHVHAAEGIGLLEIPPNSNIDNQTRPRWVRTLSAFHSSSG